jgi:hypothetical protein
LVLLQQADGSWPLSAELLDAVGLPGALAPRLRQALRGDQLTALATALALCWLRRNAAAAADEWRLLADKAERWLAQAPPPPAGDSWLDLAERVVTQGGIP